MPLVSEAELVAGAIAGKLASFPTDTVPALAVRPDCAASIFAAKQRLPDKPLILMGATAADLWDYACGSDLERAAWASAVRNDWPGQLTLVLPAGSNVPPAVNPNDPSTIGLRVPDSDFARAILAATGPLATTSANRSGCAPLKTPEAIARAFPDALVLDVAVPPSSGVPSTVAKWTKAGWEILRHGGVAADSLPTI
ncbi:putative translation factor (SUA5) [Rubidibacter lacunae KORDI 51-2]|uniref:L-threonylcarbamoyladenylate synthase n=1 Tax=Rubidibacter lacunae KORDI 51-2 TaxID=582515 RepID=U5DFY1_9CHRO|nr:L-threonylcarbamoyladenylate synthase [Rubidibacter lacunae]ERN40506.1 putative translation factor (SUA5) [Rubidibacter lacunae KORDI 51-2]